MKLSDTDIEKALDDGRLLIEPRPPAARINGVSVDLLLGDRFRLFDYPHEVSGIDLTGDQEDISAATERVMRNVVTLAADETIHLHPGEMMLGATHEVVRLPADLSGWLNGRSSLARLGLMVHITAHAVDPGFHGPIVLEFYNSGRLPLALRPGMKICSISFETLSSPAIRPYNRRVDAKYQGQEGPVASRIFRDSPGES